MKELKERYNVSDVYLIGFSQGCGMSYTTGIQNSELFTGLICCGGWLDTDRLTEEVIKAAKDLRIFIIHGREDRMVEFKAGEEANKTLKDAGYDVTFYPFDGAHRIPREGLEEACKWMKAK